MIKKFIKSLFSEEEKHRYYNPYITFIRNTKKKIYPHCGKHTELFGPLRLDPNLVELEDYTRLQPNVEIISAGGRVKVKKFTAIGSGCLIIPGSHIPTVGLPQYLSRTHINDTETTIVINEDVWVGARSILLSHCSIGRGAVIAAGSTVTKIIPPYAVVAGAPCKIIATRFTIEQILAHEAILYPPEERFSRKYLEELFETNYKNLRSIGTDKISSKDLLILNQLKEEKGIINYETIK